MHEMIYFVEGPLRGRKRPHKGPGSPNVFREFDPPKIADARPWQAGDPLPPSITSTTYELAPVLFQTTSGPRRMWVATVSGSAPSTTEALLAFLMEQFQEAPL